MIYIDFDSTIFDTNRFYDDFLKICLKNNLTHDKVKKVKDKFFKHNIDFNLDKLANELYVKYSLKEDFLREIENFYSEKYLYKDAINFLEKLYLKNDFVLLTYGNRNYQAKKINKCNINKYFKDIIITEKNKSNLNIDYVNNIFIDNNPNELLGYYKNGARYLIRVRKENDKYSRQDLILNIIEVENYGEMFSKKILKEVINYE